MHLRFPITTLALLLTGPNVSSSFQLSIPAGVRRRPAPYCVHNHHHHNDVGKLVVLHASSSSSEEEDNDEIVFAVDPDRGKEPEVTDADWELVRAICAVGDAPAREERLVRELPTMAPGLLMALRSAAGDQVVNSTIEEEDVRTLRTVGLALERVLDTRLQSGRDLLRELLECGELRRLDAAIGRASREGKLDMAFFTVLNMNVNDAHTNDNDDGVATAVTRTVDMENQSDTAAPSTPTSPAATRLSILQHIYTRCQEEVEKTVDPGVALLNKLLRTDVDSIRTNQLRYYLCPQDTNIIVTPDGQTLDLGQKPAEVGLDRFVDALAAAVQQIRAVEDAGGADRRTAAGLVEDCRQVAIEARNVVATEFGAQSAELQSFQDRLQPVFRPSA